MTYVGDKLVHVRKRVTHYLAVLALWHNARGSIFCMARLLLNTLEVIFVCPTVQHATS